MRFLNQAGETFDHTSFKMCGKFDGICGEACPIFRKIGKAQITHKDCTDWIERNSESAAQFMGYGIVDQGTKPGEKIAPTRKSILDQAMKCISGERAQDYGTPEHSLTTIGRLWAGYINGKFATNIDISGADASAMMVLFKMARVATGHNKEDNWVDAAGYAACGGELEGRSRSED